jgi:hypothetical protein
MARTGYESPLSLDGRSPKNSGVQNAPWTRRIVGFVELMLWKILVRRVDDIGKGMIEAQGLECTEWSRQRLPGDDTI